MPIGPAFSSRRRKGDVIGSSISYAVGDVHGRADLLSALLGAIERDAAAAGAAPAVTFLGDIVDRGPDSRRCLDITMETLARWPGSRLLLGNHDAWFLSVVAGEGLDDEEFVLWIEQGGRETLGSYGLDESEGPQRLGERLRRLAPGHADLLRHASTIAIDDDFAFVHAGIDPARSVFSQKRQISLTIRAPFLTHVGALERVVVHGHTPQRPPRPAVTENRISLDTGAVFTGVLTALAIDRRRRRLRFLATSPSGGVAPIEPVRLDRGQGTVLDAWTGVED